MNARRSALLAVAGGVLGAVLVVLAAFHTEATFGQRCVTAGYPTGSPAFHECVGRLARGGTP
jgi:hypothetical protein